MKKSLIVIHKYKDKWIKTYKLTQAQTSVGSYRQAKIHLLGSHVAGLACIIEKGNKDWKILDLGSESDMKADNKKFTEFEFKSRCILQIGDNQLELQNVDESRTVFAEEKNSELASGGRNTFYVAKWKGKIIASSFTKSDVMDYKLDSIKINEFRISKKTAFAPEGVTIQPELKKPLMGSAGLFLVFMLLFIGLPGLKTKEVEKPKDNIYTRMIFDSKVLTERKKQLQSSGSKVLKGFAGNNQNQAAMKKTTAPESKAVASIRQAGISSIITKIASQASKNALLVAKLAAMPQADASIDGQKLNKFGQLRDSQAAGGKTDILSGSNGFKIGAIGTAGKGGGQGGYKKGSDLGDGGVGKGNLVIDDTETVVEGGLDKDVIAKVIREHLGQIRYCYDRQLASDSGLHGKVKVNFSIDPNGRVETQSVGESTMNNAMIEECILRRIATWKFPKPKGGTKVLVSYPFLFKSVN